MDKQKKNFKEIENREKNVDRKGFMKYFSLNLLHQSIINQVETHKI